MGRKKRKGDNTANDLKKRPSAETPTAGMPTHAATGSSPNANPNSGQDDTDDPDDESWFVDITESGRSAVYFPDPPGPPVKPKPDRPASPTPNNDD